MKIRTYGALASAFALTLSAGSAQARDCACNCPPKAMHHTNLHHTNLCHAPAHSHKSADAEYAQSFYNYQSHSTVSELLVRRTSMAPGRDHWRVAPNDAKIRFHPYDVGMMAPRRPAVALNDNDLSGGVGDTEGADSGGYGHLYTGGVGENGPSYNSYDESFSTGVFSQGGARFEHPASPRGYNLPNGHNNGY